MAPHTWSYLGDTVSDATHRMYYRGQRIKEAYYRGEKIWGEESQTRFRVRVINGVGNAPTVGRDRYAYGNKKYASGLRVKFVGEFLEYSVDDGEHVIVEGSDTESTTAIIYENEPRKSVIVTFYGLERLGHIDFQKSGSLTEVIDPIPSMPLCNSMNNLFRDCVLLSDFPEGLFDNNPQILNFDYAFAYTNIGVERNNSKLSKLFNINKLATSFIGTFTAVKFSSNLTSLHRLFVGLSNVITFQECFACASGFDGYSNHFDRMFFDAINATDFTEVFAESSIEYVSNNLFKCNTKASKFIGSFVACRNLTEINRSAFVWNRDAKDFAFCFAYCNFTSIPAGLFSGNIHVESFAGTFMACTNLTSIPSNFFGGKNEAYDFDATFMWCTNLSSIPSLLFPNQSNHFDDQNGTITPFSPLTFAHCFEGCEALTTIPSGLFSYLNRINKVAATPISPHIIDYAYLNNEVLSFWVDDTCTIYDYVQVSDTHYMYGNMRKRRYIGSENGTNSYYINSSVSLLPRVPIKDRYLDAIVWAPNGAVDHYNYGYYSLEEAGILKNGTFRYMFKECTNLTTEIPTSFWDRPSLYGDNTQYIPNLNSMYAPQNKALIEKGNTSMTTPAYAAYDCGTYTEAMRIFSLLMKVGDCFYKCDKIPNLYDVPSMFYVGDNNAAICYPIEEENQNA